MTKSELKDIIKECLYENGIIEPIEEASFGSLKKYCNNEEKTNYYNKIKNDKSWLEKILNKCSEEAFESFRDKLSSNKHYKDDLDNFYKKNKKAPKVSSYNWDTDYIDFCFDTKGSNDIALFYQDYVMKYITKNKELRSKGYRFKSDDYIGIYIIA